MVKKNNDTRPLPSPPPPPDQSFDKNYFKDSKSSRISKYFLPKPLKILNNKRKSAEFFLHSALARKSWSDLAMVVSDSVVGWSYFWNFFWHMSCSSRLLWDPKSKIYFDLLLFHLVQGFTRPQKTPKIPKIGLKSDNFFWTFLKESSETKRVPYFI